MSKLSLIHPQPKGLEPYVIKAAIDPAAVTACLWTSDQSLESIPAWATRWPGPMSVLMTTAALPSSTEHEALLNRLSALQSQNPHVNSTLSLHLLHLDPKTPDNPNAFLNLARLFAQTSRVVLFPGNFSSAPPKALYRSILAQQSGPSASIEPAPGHIAFKHKPVIFTMRGQTSFPFSPLAPVMLARDDAVWCTERFFPPLSRAADWEECLWQVWLENFGDVDVRQSRGWLQEASPVLSADSALAVSACIKLRRRLVAKYRSETCVLSTRQLAALRGANKGVDAKKTRWLKRICRNWISA
ncbi:hypothetical protein OBBRIDRAFT_734784 [Obba rivulosa]|uniref:Uncharacterized protein n=1 Tax=Obba rivulosa TaxID=1052685 RepID=A0A8E2DIR7_9APHY|nr:hypothetical protein OBBRIDRAFT_734784 [Obba rivulosa]